MLKAQAQLNLQLAREEDFWRKKAGMDWFKDGERNTKFFHIVCKGRRNILKLKRIQNDDGEWLYESNQIAEADIQFY